MPAASSASTRSSTASARRCDRTRRSAAGRRRSTSRPPSSARRAASRPRACGRPRAAPPRRSRGSPRRASATSPAATGRWASCARAGRRTARGAPAAAARARATGSQTSQHGPVGRGRRAVAEVAQDPLAAALRALDPGPHGAVLAPAGARALLRRRAAARERAAVPLAGQPPGHAVGRRGRRLHDPGAREVADDRADLLLVAGERGEVARRHVVARQRRGAAARRRGRRVGRAHDRARDRLQLVVADRRALDEEHVQPLVAARREQQAARRARRRAPRGRPPGSRPRSSSARSRGRRSARRPCRRPSRTRWWPRRPGTSPAMKRRCASARSSRARPAWYGDHLHPELGRQPPRQPVALRAGARVDDRRAARRARRAPRRSRGGPASLVAHGTTANDRFGRSNPVATCTGSRSPRRCTMSAATCGVAVAVDADDRLGAEPARRVGEPEVVRAEVVPPLGHAVRLVDHEQPDLRLADALQEPGRGEPLGRDVEQPHVPGHRALDRTRGWSRRPAGR